MEVAELDFIDLCKTLIEEKYHLGHGEGRLRQRDFEYLLDQIEETSGIRLSVSTLKRLWRDPGGQNPHPATLDALVSTLGYKDWLDFKVQNAPGPRRIGADRTEPPDRPDGFGAHPKTPVIPRRALWAAGVPALAAILIGITSSYLDDTAPRPDGRTVSFGVSNTVAAGVPTTVVFTYDLGNVAADTFYIQQDWNPANVHAVDSTSGHFTSVYYLPGYHRVRLFADTSMLRTAEVFIRTDGWLAAALYGFDRPPVYLPQDRSSDGILSIRKEQLLEKNVDMDRLMGTFLFNVRDFGGLDSRNFKAETRFRLRNLTEAPCPRVQFTIHTEANIHFAQLAPIGCVGELAVMMGGTYRSGRDHDLSALGADVHAWQDLGITVKNNQATIYLNGKPVLEQAFDLDFGDVVGVDYRFSGVGDVDYLRLIKPDDRLVYGEEF